MRLNRETQDILSITVTAVVALLAVTLMVLNLAPGSASGKEAIDATGGRAVEYEDACTPVGTEFNADWLDLNQDGAIDFYDFDDVLDGKVDCQVQQCDVTADGVVDERDRIAFNMLVLRLYDYDNDQELTRDDPRVLADIIYYEAGCDANHLCDLNRDGLICSDDIALYTGLLFNYDHTENIVGSAKYAIREGGKTLGAGVVK